jgi:hypothetical protein
MRAATFPLKEGVACARAAALNAAKCDHQGQLSPNGDGRKMFAERRTPSRIELVTSNCCASLSVGELGSAVDAIASSSMPLRLTQQTGACREFSIYNLT